MDSSSSACLARSFSQPSQERTEGDPLRALTTSVSFGRFMSESLDWEKWSSFTHNRYLEEVEKYAKPGSVAEKKAYFEAQHRKAAAKKAALLLEQRNAAVDESSDPNEMNKNTYHSTVNSESTGSSYMGIEEMQREALDVNTQIVDDSQRKSKFTENGSYGGTEEAQGEQGHLNVTNPSVDHCTMRFELPENSSHMGIEEVQVNEGDNATTYGSYPINEEFNLETTGTENSIKKSYPVENEVKSLNRPENVVVEVSENIAQLKEKTQTKNASMAGDSVLLSMKKKPKKPLTLMTRLTNKNESSKFKSRVKPVTVLQPIVTEKSAPTSRKNGQVLIDKKQSNPKSRLMSIKFFSHREETKKKLSPILEKIVNSRLVRSINKTSRDSKVQQTSVLALVSGISKYPETPLRENRRDRMKLDQSLCRSRKEEGESLSHLGNLKSINKHGNIICSPTVVSPFTLRSEERAAKRREFFQKLEQKLNTKEAEKEQRQAKPKENATSSSKVLISRTKPNPSVHHERESSNNQMKKGKATSSSNMLVSTAKPNPSIHQERESSSNQTKKEKATSSSKVLTSRARPNALIHQSRAESNASTHQERESSSNQTKKIPRQPGSPKFSGKQVSEVQDNKPRQPWRFSGKPEGSKDVKRENYLSNHFPVKGRSDNPKSFISESMWENASPNIQV